MVLRPSLLIFRYTQVPPEMTPVHKTSDNTLAANNAFNLNVTSPISGNNNIDKARRQSLAKS